MEWLYITIENKFINKDKDLIIELYFELVNPINGNGINTTRCLDYKKDNLESKFYKDIEETLTDYFQVDPIVIKLMDTCEVLKTIKEILI